MDYPHRHSHHHSGDRREEEFPPPPPPQPFGAPPPPQVYHTSHHAGDRRDDVYPPPPHVHHNIHHRPGPDFGYPGPPPGLGTAQDAFFPHQAGPTPPDFGYPPHAPSHGPHHGPGPDYGYSGPPLCPGTAQDAFFPHQGGPTPPDFGRPPHAASDGPIQNDPAYAHKPTVRVYCRAESGKSLAIAHGKLLLVAADPSDPFQHWIKDEMFSTRVKDEEGFPSFSLINKATGQALKHATGPKHPVQLIPYNPNRLDESVLWTESRDTGDNYRAIRMVNNIKLNVDAAWSSGNRYGSSILLWEWKKGDNQRWKIVPYCNSHISGSICIFLFNSTPDCFPFHSTGCKHGLLVCSSPS